MRTINVSETSLKNAAINAIGAARNAKNTAMKAAAEAAAKAALKASVIYKKKAKCNMQHAKSRKNIPRFMR